MKVILTAVNILLLQTLLVAQSLPIFLDGVTNDWPASVATYTDTDNDGATYDFKYFSVTNDEKFLFIKLKITPFIKLLENNQLSLYIDGDNNSSTGFLINGIGAELRFNFGSRNGFNYYTNSSFSHPAIGFRSLPTVTDTVFEIAVRRQNIPPSGGNGSIRLFFIDNVTSGDRMPNNGETFAYSIDNTPVEALVPIDIARADTSFLRVLNWNTLEDGLLSTTREQYFRRILQAIKPDVLVFNEMWNSTAAGVQSKLNSMIPLQQGSWQTVKLDAGNVIASKYPITQSWLVYPGQRITASLIDVPERFGRDILVIACHFKCCGGESNDAIRQREADAVVSFILDAKSPGGNITLPQFTPFVITGDLNFVGDRQQLITLLSGQIINTNLFGNGAPPDWDNTGMEDVIAMQTDKRTAYTWRNDAGTYPPGRLDFQIYSNSVVSLEKQFIVQTEVMPSERLSQYSLLANDSKNASDHFPKVTDISFNIPTGILSNTEPAEFELEQNFPNPFNPETVIRFSTLRTERVRLAVFDALGKEVAVLLDELRSAGSYQVIFNASELPAGNYFCRMEAGGNIIVRKMTLLK